MVAATAAVMSSITPDAWLSRMLGRTAWRVEADALDLATTLSGTGCGPGFFFARVPAGNVQRLQQFEDFGFRVVDMTITLEAAAKELQATTLPNARHASPEDRAAVAALAATSFEWSRLHLDPAIPNAIADRSRAEWVSNFYERTRGDALVIAPHDGAPMAFLLALGPADGKLTIDLIAVHPSSRRLGLGAACIRFAAAQIVGTDRLSVGTQAANIGSLRFYESLGFRTVASHYVVHLHRS